MNLRSTQVVITLALLTYSDLQRTSGASLVIPLDDDPDNGRLGYFVDEQIKLASQNGTDGLSETLDIVALKLAEASLNGKYGKRFRADLAKVINLTDIEPDLQDVPKIEKPHPRSSIKASGGLLDVLEEADKNVVFADRRLSEQAKQDLIVFGMLDSISVKRFQFAQMLVESDFELNKISKQTGSPTLEAFKTFVIEATKVGTLLLDQLYATPTFMEYLPVIGDGIRILKLQGRATYSIIQTVRSIRTYMHLEAIENAQLSGSDPRIIGRVGMKALKALARRLVGRRDESAPSNEVLKEIVGRCAYYLLIHAASNAACNRRN